MASTVTQTLIAQIEPPQSDTTGDYYYRTYAPGQVLAEQEGVHFVGLTSLHRNRDRIMLNADVVILKNICDPDFLPLIAERKRLGRPTVYEIADDLWNLQPWNAVYLFYQVEENRQLLKTTASYCDALQFTTKKLEERYGHLNPVCDVFPNQILAPPCFTARSNRDESVVNIGWGGSHGHFEDIKTVAPALTNWLINNNAVLHLMCSDTIWKLFDSLPSEKKMRYKPGAITDYYDFLTHLDIGLAPLDNTPFNRSRSDVKFLEYAVNEIVPVVQHLEPYKDSVKHGTNGYLFRNYSELVAILNILAGGRNVLRMTGLLAKTYVMRERLQREHVDERIKFYRMVAHQVAQRAGGTSGRGNNIIEQIAAMDGAEVHGRHITLKFSKYENLLHNGLVSLQTGGDKSEAHRMLAEAAEIAGEEYLPHLLLHTIAENPNGHLKKALEKNPMSVRSLILLGERYANSGRYIESLECFQKAATMQPNYDVPFKRMVIALRKIGCIDEALKLDCYIADKWKIYGEPLPISPMSSMFRLR